MTDPYEELAQRAGLLLDDVGRRVLQRVDPGSPTALEQAVEILAVPESWFFRDGEPFVCLSQYAAAGPRPLRVLSAPCSTGEEPYSIAIALLEAGLAPDDFVIDAIDISANALAASRRACYGAASFRHPMPGLFEKYFRQTEQGFQLAAEVASLVRFQRANLLEGLGQVRPYHVIFCRNLLIYLHEEARKTVFAVMRGALSDAGVLFAGHSEIALFTKEGFRRVQHPRSFACCKQHAVPAPLPVRAIRSAPKERPHPVPEQPVPPEAAPGLDEARRLADQGRLAEAAAVCKTLAPGADVFCLLGLISRASERRTEAEEYFRKALYLEPDHPEALLHMSLLCASLGDARRSALFRDRARRPRQEVKS